MITIKEMPGTVDGKANNDAIKSIEVYTARYKKKRMSTQSYITSVHIELAKLTNTRDYLKYLQDIGQK